MGKPQLQLKSRVLQALLNRKDALVCLVNQGIVSVAGFATSVYIGQQSASELGLYYIGLSLVLFARGFQQQYVSTPYSIYLPRQPDEDRPGYRGSCLVQQFGFVIITLIYLLAQILAAYAGWISVELVSSLLVLLVFLPAILLRELVRHYCFTHSENRGVMGVDIAISVLQIVALVGLGYFGFLTAATAWCAIGLSTILSIGYWYLRRGPKIKFQRERFPKDWKLNWSFGKWAVAGQFVGSLPSYLLPLMLLQSATTEELGSERTGYFAACMTLVGVANIFNMGMLNFLTPRAAKVFLHEGSAGLKRLLLQMYGLFLIAVGGFAIFLVFFGSFITVKIFGPEYAGLQTALILLAVAKLLEGFSHTASGGLFAMEKIKANFFVDVILMVITITAAVVLIYSYGVVGAAWTTLIGSLTCAILRSGLLFKFLAESKVKGTSDV